ncbi:TPA: transglycosylase SLT domain-containing protein, partial [Pseudomonas aeruginosa]|nr:transglycosylase SLT domain-containing protein [Pseudomonas aeruginosa]HCE7731906.1 transglycosylase SLT domain-containing protein [Pseudomonas aeruginosa]
LLTACQPAFAADRIPTAAEQYRRTLVRSAHAGWGLSAPIATFAAQVHQESRWRADARSPVGAQGLAQFMPGTAEWIAGLYPAVLGTNQPFNPGWALR